MSQHRSLKASISGKGHRNVLKRLERMKKLKEDERWDESRDSVFGLAKVRSIKVKAKAKSAKAAEAEAAGETAAPEAPVADKKAGKGEKES